MPPVYRAEYRQAIAIVRQRLNEEAFREIWIDGSKTSLEYIISQLTQNNGR